MAVLVNKKVLVSCVIVWETGTWCLFMFKLCNTSLIINLQMKHFFCAIKLPSIVFILYLIDSKSSIYCM